MNYRYWDIQTMNYSILGYTLVYLLGYTNCELGDYIHCTQAVTHATY